MLMPKRIKTSVKIKNKREIKTGWHINPEPGDDIRTLNISQGISVSFSDYFTLEAIGMTFGVSRDYAKTLTHDEGFE